LNKGSKLSEKQIENQAGVNVEKALQGDYALNVKDILQEAWQSTLRSRMSINIGLCFVLLLGMLVSLVTSSFMGGIEVILKDPSASMLINIVVTVIIWPFIAGIEMMGIQHAYGIKTRALMVFSCLQRGSWVALCALLTSLLISLGFQLLIVPGIFLAVVLSLTIPLVIDKKMSPMQAIKISILSLRFKFFHLFRLYLLLFIALIVLTAPIVLLAESSLGPIAIVLFLFGMSFLAPLYYNVKGIVYREVYGSDTLSLNDTGSHRGTEEQLKKYNNTEKSNGSDDTFSA
jgi:hypothetical protein